MLHNLLSDVTDPIERARATFALWNSMHRISQIPAEYPLAMLSEPHASRLKELRERRKDRIAEIHLRKRLAWFDCDGHVNVIVSSMDCDCARSVTLTTVPSDFGAFTAWVDNLYEWAEGPTSFRIVSDEEAEDFVPEFRDLALEAFEDGHPHVVYA